MTCGRAVGPPCSSQRLLDRAGEDRVRADLDEVWCSRRRRRVRVACLEAHGLAQVGVPVVGVSAAVSIRSPVTVEKNGHGGRPGRDAAEDGGQHVLERLDVGGVRGVVDRDPPGPYVLRCLQAVQRVRPAPPASPETTVAARAVERDRDADPARRSRRSARSTSSAGLRDGGHGALARPARRSARLRSATTLRGVLQGRAPRRRRRRRSRPGSGRPRRRAAPRSARHSRGQRHHHREQRRLHDVDAVRVGAALGAGEHVEQRPVGVRGQRLGARGHGAARTPVRCSAVPAPCRSTASPGRGRRRRSCRRCRRRP